MATDTHILVVEDQRAVAGALRMRLRGLGYDVMDIAKDGNEAILKAGVLRPDLILMDIRLGEGMDGIEAATQIRSLFDIPVVYVTAYADHELLDRARATHPAGFINKPFTTKDLLTTINLALHQDDLVDDASGGQRQRLREAVITTNREGQISYLSVGAEQLTGWTRSATIGQALRSALVTLYPLAPDVAQLIVDKVLNNGATHVLHRCGANPSSPGDVLSPLTDAHGMRFGAALRFDTSTVESNLSVPRAVADACRFILDQVPIGAVLIDQNLKIHHINAHAATVVQTMSSLDASNGHFRLIDAVRNDALRQTIRRITNDQTPTATSENELIPLEFQDGTPHIIAIAAAVPASEALRAVPMAVLMLFDLSHRRPLSSSVLEQIYGLTRSEIRLVQSLVGGCSLEDGAKELGISVNTARTHLKHIFHKTGAKRQSELIHKIETGPASLGISVRKS